MTKHPRLQAIPGCEDQHLVNLAKLRTDMQMTVEGLQSLPIDAAMYIVEQHFEARPDIEPFDFEEFTNRLRRLAWKRQGEQAHD